MLKTYKHIIALYGQDAFKKHYEANRNKWMTANIDTPDSQGAWSPEFFAEIKDLPGYNPVKNSIEFLPNIRYFFNDNDEYSYTFEPAGSVGSFVPEPTRYWQFFYLPVKNLFLWLPTGAIPSDDIQKIKEHASKIDTSKKADYVRVNL